MAVVELNRVGPESAAVPPRGIREALHRLRAVESTLQMLDSVTAEVCRSCGFDRCVFFRLDGASLTPERAHFAGDPHWQDDWLDSARSHPVVLDARDPEINLLRRQVAVLAIDARESAHGVREILDGAGMTAYVAAPVTVRGNVIGTLHADRYFGGRGVDVVARDVLAVFAEGFSCALERTLLLERMRLQSRRGAALQAPCGGIAAEVAGVVRVWLLPPGPRSTTTAHPPAPAAPRPRAPPSDAAAGLRALDADDDPARTDRRRVSARAGPFCPLVADAGGPRSSVWTAGDHPDE